MKQSSATAARSGKPSAIWLEPLLFLLILGAAAFFRISGYRWGEYQYLHPDERFLIWVTNDISPVKSLSEYFDTARSSLNPHNRGHGFYVYGTFPLFLTRYLVEGIFGHPGWQETSDLGRLLSALADLGTVCLVYAMGRRLYGRRVALLGMAFSAATVLQIQQSHFFTMDTFTTFFSTLALYYAVQVASSESEAPLKQLSLAFGVALGMAVASKINTALVAFTLPLAMAIYALRLPPQERERQALRLALYLSLAAAISLLVFRLLQPYAFSGPGFFGLKPNPQWVENIRSQRAQASPDFDFPPNMQWARRPLWFSFQNLTVWGLGLPLGLLAWAGFLWVGWRLLTVWQSDRRQWLRHSLVWFWTAAYFTWQSLQRNPTMRYQLPIYPTLALFAAWAVWALYERRQQTLASRSELPARGWERPLALALMGAVLVATFAYAYAFVGIYRRPITRVAASRWIYQNIPGPITLTIQNGEETFHQIVPFPYGLRVTPQTPYITTFTARHSGQITSLLLPRLRHEGAGPAALTLRLAIRQEAWSERPLAEAILQAELPATPPGEGQRFTIALQPPLQVEEGRSYGFTLSVEAGEAPVALEGLALANEGEWDDGLPLRVDGYDGFSGIYPPDLNFNMYWDDNEEKRERFYRILDQADYLLISSNRQWGSLPRLPERFPLTTAYYRYLLGCPDTRSVEWCYRVAQPGTFHSALGFDLVAVFTSEPRLGSLRLNDQFAEEAFTVYDHPKVFIFKKSAAYNPATVRDLLGAVDLSKVMRIPPLRAPSHPADLKLPWERWSEQQAGGTWSELFPAEALPNRYPALAVLLWYLTITLLGWLAYPMLRWATPALEDRAYPLGRITGMLLLSYLVWMAGSYRVPVTRASIAITLGTLALLSALFYRLQWGEVRAEVRQKWRYLLIVEGLAVAFFATFLLIRWGNPDLWHPWKGGEKPMDFAYLNAVLKSTTFPPYDPWYAGGYLNYYYYGFVLVGIPVKLLGIAPAVAYNLILPTLFSLIALGAFSIAWNLAQKASAQRAAQGAPEEARRVSPYWAGLAGALGMAVLGNLGTVRMLYQGFQRLAAPAGVIEGAPLPTLWVWTLRGFAQALSGARLPYSLGDWYWIPSRAIPAPNDVEPITEFPFFTVLYADLHAHLIALPLTLLALGLIAAFLLGKGHWPRRGGAALWFVLTGLTIGALRPTNTWDMPTYLTLGVVVVLYTWGRYVALSSPWKERLPFLGWLNTAQQRLALALGGALLLVGLALWLYHPYAQWYALGYTRVDLWKGTRTPTYSYLIHWGVFLFCIVTWMVWESRDWLAKTPLSALRRLAPYRRLIQTAAFLGVAVTLGLTLYGVRIAWLVLPLAAWAGLLLLRSDQPDAKRLVLFMVGTGLILTLVVEVFVLRGDVGRMNTVFKFYLQVWTLFALSAAAALAWILPALEDWWPSWRNTWQFLLIALVSGAALYPLMATTAKVADRISPDTPHTLDGMAFMAYSTYTDEWGTMDLNQDYAAIRWMLANVSGSPVIVEANLRNLYRWGSRFSIYTGLPGVVGWEWHQQQQRAVLPPQWVTERIAEVDAFYTTLDWEMTLAFLRKYRVRYIILGQQERGHYPGPGLEKFPAGEGLFWKEVYRDRDTVIYEVFND